MIIVKPYTAFPGDIIRSSQYNNNFDTIYNDYNGNIDNSNIASTAGIQYSKLQALPSAQIILGSAGNVATPRTMSGDATISNTGVITVTGSSTAFLLPAPNPPTAYRQIALVGAMGVNAVVQVHNGTSVNTYFRTDTYVEAATTGGSSINLGLMNDAAFADVGSGSSITFTVNVPGRYKVEFIFTVQMESGIAADLLTNTQFRLTDGTTNKNLVNYGAAIVNNPVAPTSIDTPVFLSDVFDYTTTGSKTVKLQKKNTQSGSISIRALIVDGTSNAVIMRAFRVAES